MTRRILLLISLLGAPTAQAVPALQNLADQIAAQATQVLKSMGPETPSVAVLVVADQSLMGREARIAGELAGLLVFRLEHSSAVERAVEVTKAEGQSPIDAAQQSGVGYLLRCTLGLKGEELHASADLISLEIPLWERLSDRAPRGDQHMFAAVPSDREIVVLLGAAPAPPPTGGFSLRELIAVPERVFDLGLGDLDGDGQAEIVLLTETALHVYSLKDNALERRTGADLRPLPRALLQSRDPASGLVVADFNKDGQCEVFYKTSRLRFGEVLAWSGAGLRPLRRLQRMPLCANRRGGRPFLVTGTEVPGQNLLAAQVEVADINEPTGRSVALPGRIAWLRCYQRGEEPPWAIAVDENATLHWLGANFEVTSSTKGFGATAVLDLNLDGAPDLIASEPSWPGEPDALRVISRGEPIWRSAALIGSVVAIAADSGPKSPRPRAAVATVEASGASRIYLLGR